MTTLESPLVQVEQGNLRPKVLSLYENLFTPNDDGTRGKSKGYWTEFFVLRCNKSALSAIFNDIPAGKLLSDSETTRELFGEAIESLASDNVNVVDNSLQILAVFFQSIFAKNFVSYSSDVITILAGLDSIDLVFLKFLDSIENLIKHGPTLAIQINALRTTTIVAGGAYQTSLGSYFTQRDLFVSLMGFIQKEGTQLYLGDAFCLLGILASYDKLEAHNPYQTRLADFVDEAAMTKIISSSRHVWKSCYDEYAIAVAVTLTPTAERIGFTLAHWMGFRTGAATTIPAARTPSVPDTPKIMTDLPNQTISLLLGIYEFVNANRTFARLFLQTRDDDPSGPPFALFISLCSFMFQNQHKSPRASSYSRLCLIIIRILVESTASVSSQLISSDLVTKSFQIGRQRTPFLPLSDSRHDRLLLEGILDSLQCALRYNLKKSLDCEMYVLTLETLFQILAFLRSSKYALTYHWSELWRTIMTAIKFIAVKEKTSSQAPVVQLLLLIVATCLIHGDILMAKTKEFDDLLYKVIESAQSFEKLKTLYNLDSSPSMAVINAAINHYSRMLESQKIPANQISANAVSQIIKQGYGSLSLYQYAATTESRGSSALLFDYLPKYKESDERLFLKKITRLVTADTTFLYARDS